jgi:hypothetical protein
MNKIEKFEKGYAAGFSLDTPTLAVYKSEDGTKWEPVEALIQSYRDFSANDVLVYDKKTIFIVGKVSSGGGFLLWTNDDGKEWHLDDFEKEVVCVGIVNSQIWLSAHEGIVYKRDKYYDINSIWYSFNLHEKARASGDILLQGLACVDTDEVYVAGNTDGSKGGGIWYTKNGGEAWREIKPPSPSTKAPLNYLGIVLKTRDLVYFFGATGLLLKFNGYKWQYIQEPAGGSGHDVNQIFVVDENNIWLACDWEIARYDGKKITTIPCETEGNFMTGISVWGNYIWACGITGASAPTKGILTLSKSLGEKGSWNTIARKQLWKISICIESV